MIMLWFLVPSQPRFESQPVNFSKTPFCDSFFASSDFNFSLSSVRNTRLKMGKTILSTQNHLFWNYLNKIKSNRLKVTYDPFFAPNGLCSMALSTPLIALQKINHKSFVRLNYFLSYFFSERCLFSTYISTSFKSLFFLQIIWGNKFNSSNQIQYE